MNAPKQDASPTGDSGLGIDTSTGNTPSSSASGEMTALIDPITKTSLMEQEAEKRKFFERPIELRPIKVMSLETYVMDRKDNESEELRKEYKVRQVL